MPSDRTTAADEMPSDRVLALDNVPLDLPIAGAGTRTLAGAIDYAVLTAGIIVTVFGSIFAAHRLQLHSPWWLAALLLEVFALEYGYFAVSEVVTGGRTLGKRALALSVVSREGIRASNAALLLRNAVRLIDLFVGVPLMILDPLSRRLGDRLAGTLVLRTADPRPVFVRRIPAGFGPKEIAVLEDFVRRCDELEPDRAEALARALVALIERRDRGFIAPELSAASAVARVKISVR